MNTNTSTNPCKTTAKPTNPPLPTPPPPPPTFPSFPFRADSSGIRRSHHPFHSSLPAYPYPYPYEQRYGYIKDAENREKDPVLDTVDTGALYRLLVSRGVTQGLHLLDSRGGGGESGDGGESRDEDREEEEEEWVIKDRMISKERVGRGLVGLGVVWDHYVADVLRAEKVVHVLYPVKYEPWGSRLDGVGLEMGKGKSGSGNGNEVRNECAVRENRGAVYTRRGQEGVESGDGEGSRGGRDEGDRVAGRDLGRLREVSGRGLVAVRRAEV
ncbi:hypothetical protein P280DRAFT_511020 [Massarina eburnea CBS 473.64]|uniref:Uncharacterized protein n=1 Tax=Massarina eburnea CBS 473.64 TaxID=1395130 RepID=A0A6A6RKN7_9PLEO|nr:hypothetical protein P280DRAFT_511020 [Massarina eburnea CBS 473.64]